MTKNKKALIPEQGSLIPVHLPIADEVKEVKKKLDQRCVLARGIYLIFYEV